MVTAHTRFLFLLATAIALPLYTAQAQPQSTRLQGDNVPSRMPGNERLPVERLSLNEGLSNSNILAIHQDRQGFMWFGTANGANKYDGHSFTSYKLAPGDTNSVSDTSVRLIHEDASGDLWMATNDGWLNRLNPTTGQITRYKHDPRDPRSLSGAGVIGFHVSRDGSLWIRTLEGLNRYVPEMDGFVQYVHDPDDENTLSANYIWMLHEDATGMLWLVTRSREEGDRADEAYLDRLDPVTGHVTRMRHNPDDETSIASDLMMTLNWWSGRTSAVLEDRRGHIWVGSENLLNDLSDRTTQGELNRYDPETGHFTRYVHDPDNPGSLGRGVVAQLYEDRTGQIWVAMAYYPQGGWSRYDPETDSFIHYEGLRGEIVFECYEDRAGQLWLITLAEPPGQQDIIRLQRFDPEQERFITFEPDPSDPTLPHSKVLSILGEDEQGYLWFYATNAGVERYDPVSGTFTRYASDPSDPRTMSGNRLNRTPRLFQDRTGVLWFGMSNAGVNKIDPRPLKFHPVQHDPNDPGSLGYPSVRTFYQDRAGVLWVGTDTGLDRYDPATGRFLHYRHVPILPFVSRTNNAVFALLEDQTGQFWVGTDFGLYHFDRETAKFTHVPLNPENPNESDRYFRINDLMEDHNGTLWVATSPEGLYRYDRDTGIFAQFSHDPTDPGRVAIRKGIYALYEDEKNRLWTGTEDGGLQNFNPETETFTAYRHDPGDPTSLSYDFVAGVHGDPSDPDILWVGTYGGGLNRFDVQEGTFTWYTETNSDLPDNVVYAVLPDERGHLWLSTNAGLSRFEPQTERFRTYDVDDGLQSREFNRRAAYKAADGALFFGGVNGFNVFYPDRVQDDLTIPQVALTHLHIFNASEDTGTTYEGTRQEAGETLTLPYDENDLTFEYAALHYANPAKNQYRYRLAPYEATWSEPSSQRQTRYSNLDPGTYTFQLQASNSDGVWNEEGLSFRFEVRPPWWQTTWAYVLYAMLFALGVFTADRVQRRRLLRKAAEQARIERAELEAQTAEAQSRALQAENERKEVELEKAKEVEYAYSALQQAHEDLKTTQDQLIHAEKMASLGQMTAGIAHEIKNPLNFVNNFAEVNEELTEEIFEDLEANPDLRVADIQDVLADIKANASSIAKHGKRADGIVGSMMDHARSGEGERQATDVNALVEEYLNLAYHGMRAKVADFNATLDRAYDESVGQVAMVPQEIGRVLINLLNNAFYAVHERAKSVNGMYTPAVKVSTERQEGQVVIHIKDNGSGISAEMQDKIFEPFFTTKPTGQGNTGLGLSLSYDIVTQGHGGLLSVETTEGEGSTFIIAIPH